MTAKRKGTAYPPCERLEARRPTCQLLPLHLDKNIPAEGIRQMRSKAPSRRSGHRACR
jgi:hypothetical protein